MDVAPAGELGQVDVFPRHPPAGKRRCDQSRAIVPITAYVGRQR